MLKVGYTFVVRIIRRVPPSHRLPSRSPRPIEDPGVNQPPLRMGGGRPETYPVPTGRNTLCRSQMKTIGGAASRETLKSAADRDL